MTLTNAVQLTYGRWDLVEYSYITYFLFASITAESLKGALRSIGCILLSILAAIPLAAFFVFPYVGTLYGSARTSMGLPPAYLNWYVPYGHILPNIEAQMNAAAFVSLVAFPLAMSGIGKNLRMTVFCIVLTSIYVFFAYPFGLFELYQKLPFHSGHQETVRLVVLFYFGVSILAGYGIQRLEDRNFSGSGYWFRIKPIILIWGVGPLTLLVFTYVRILVLGKEMPGMLPTILIINFGDVIATSALLVWMAYYVKKPSPRVLNCISVFLAVSLLIFSYLFNYYQRDGEYAKERENRYFLDEESKKAVNFLRQEMGKKPQFRVIDGDIFPVNFWASRGIESTYFYSALPDRKIHVYYKELLGEQVKKARPYTDNLNSVFYKIANVRYVFSNRPLPYNDVELVYHSGDILGYEYKDFYPRFRVLKDFEVIPSEYETLSFLRKVAEENPGWFRSHAVLNGSPVFFAASREELGAENEKLEVRSYGDNSVSLDVTIPHEKAILIIADKYDEDWVVRVNGKEGRLLRANYLFQGIGLTKGRHSVSLEYRPKMFYLGLFVSGMTVIVGIVITGVYCFYRRNKKGSG
jgi:hypothetical protein